MPAISAIPKEIALQLCDSIRRENEAKWYSPAAWRCTICLKASHDTLPGLIDENRGCLGCSKVTARYARQYLLTTIVD